MYLEGVLWRLNELLCVECWEHNLNTASGSFCRLLCIVSHWLSPSNPMKSVLLCVILHAGNWRIRHWAKVRLSGLCSSLSHLRSLWSLALGWWIQVTFWFGGPHKDVLLREDLAALSYQLENRRYREVSITMWFLFLLAMPSQPWSWHRLYLAEPGSVRTWLSGCPESWLHWGASAPHYKRQRPAT